MATRIEQFGEEKISLSDRQLVQWPFSEIPNYVTTLHISSNSISTIPDQIERLAFLRELDVSNNRIEKISEFLGGLEFLEIFVAKNNKIIELPESFVKLKNLKQLNLAGNSLKSVPMEVCDLTRLKFLHLGGNSIKEIPLEIKHIESLEFLYLGGNQIENVPHEVGQLRSLLSLNLSSNRIAVLPRELDQLKSLESLLLHHNKLHFLPKGIIHLENLLELSLRDNPLIHKFTLNMGREIPTLVELCCYVIKKKQIPYKHRVPSYLTNFLDSSKQCDNPNCDGVYFETKVKKLKFVDFCGRYRVPLLEYLCAHCEYPYVNDRLSSSGSEDDEPIKASLKKLMMDQQ